MNSLRSSFVHIVINFRSWRASNRLSNCPNKKWRTNLLPTSRPSMINDSILARHRWDMVKVMVEWNAWLSFCSSSNCKRSPVSLSLHYKIDGFSGRFLPISSFFSLLVIPWSLSSTDERWWWCLPLKGATDTRSTQQTRCCILSNSNLQLVHILTTTETRAL